MKILYFAWIKAKIGKGQEEIALPSHVKTVNDLIAHLKTLGKPYEEAFANLGYIRTSLDQEFAHLETPLGKAQEAAFFPPVTGG